MESDKRTAEMRREYYNQTVLGQQQAELWNTEPSVCGCKSILCEDKPKFYGHPGFYELLDKMRDLHSRKNHDYAGNENPLRNFYKCREMGLTPFQGVMVRLTDKWSRLESFMRQGVLEVSGESVEDTLLDSAVYSLLAILLFREQRNEEKNLKESHTSQVISGSSI
jgi:hypothetical protein